MVTYPDDDVHRTFYGTQSNVVSTVMDGDPLEIPGFVYKSAWDGRDDTPAERILLAGEYLVTATITFDELPDDSATSEPVPITVSTPHASNYGPLYPQGITVPWDFRDDVVPAVTTQPALRDGTGYDQLWTAEQQTSSAQDARTRLVNHDAVFHFIGQSLVSAHPVALMFYSKPVPAWDWEAVFGSGLAPSLPDPAPTTWGERFGGGVVDIVSLPEPQPGERKPLADVFLAVIPVCRVDGLDSEVASEFIPLNLIDKGVDIVVAPKGCLVHGDLAYSWEQVFWDCVGNLEVTGDGMLAGVEQCSRWAGVRANELNPGSGIDPAYRACIADLRVRYAAGVDPNERLWPARYGCATN